MNTGFPAPGRPAMGAWVTYGLGSESRDLPGFVVLQSGPRGPRAGASLWGSGFLPTSYQGVPFRGKGDPILQPATAPPGITPRSRARFLRRGRRAQPRAARRDRRPGDRDAHQRLRNGLPHADERAGADGPVAGDRPRRSTLYGVEAGQAVVRQQLPAGPPAGRAGRAVRAALSHRLGQSRRPRREPERATSRRSAARSIRPAPRWCSTSSSAACSNDTLVVWGGEFGRTPMGEVREHDRPRPSHRRLHDVAGRRRREARLDPSARPTSSASASSRTRSTSTTCTPRSCTCSGFDHERAHLPLPGPRLPPDRRARPRRAGNPGVIVTGGPAEQSADRRTRPAPG